MKFSNYLLAIMTSLSCATLLADENPPHGGHAAGGELRHGRYFGYILQDSTAEKIAVVSDFYLESPDDLTLFPSLNASFKLSLGGYNTHEYFTEVFENIRYDFNNGVLVLEDPKNDLRIVAEVHTIGSATYIEGMTFFNSSGVSGRLHLELESDEPPEEEEEGGMGGETAPFVPLLQGQYEGKCGEENAVMQIQSVRGLSGFPEEGKYSAFSKHYGIVGQLSFRGSRYCSELGEASLCKIYNYHAIDYSPPSGAIRLFGNNSTEACKLAKGRLSCTLQLMGNTEGCNFVKTDVAIKPSRFFNRRHHLRASAEQAEELPSVRPPNNSELASALRGNFSGYVHNETNDTYLPVRLNVMAYSSTNNPHNPNRMMISTNASIFLGRSFESNFVTQRFETRSFYLRPGFTLNGPNADSYINVVEWKKGYIRGIWYSHAFGRVGTVQVLKGDLPSISAEAQVVRDFSGEFEGGVQGIGSRVNRWLRFVFPGNPSSLAENTILFGGDFQSVVGLTPREAIQKGAFDPYTNSIGWIREKGGRTTIISGVVDAESDLRLFWPPVPDVFGTKANEYVLDRFLRKK